VQDILTNHRRMMSGRYPGHLIVKSFERGMACSKCKPFISTALAEMLTEPLDPHICGRLTRMPVSHHGVRDFLAESTVSEMIPGEVPCRT